MRLVWLFPSLAAGLFFGLTAGYWQMAIMAGLSALVTLLMAVPKRPIVITRRGVFRGRFRLPDRMALWPRSWRDQYTAELARLVASLPGQLSKTDYSPLAFVAGYGLELNLATSGPHLFLVGPTGSGKSRWLNLMLETMSGEPELYLADFKGGATLSKFGRCVTDLDDPEVRQEFWGSVRELLESRERYLALHRVTSAAETSLPYAVVVVDELSHGLQLDRVALPTLSAVAARGRSLGVHLICANQSVSGVPRELLVNLNLRVALGGTDEIDALQLGAKKSPARIPGSGSGLVVGGAEFGFPFRQEPSRGSASSYRAP